MVNNIANKLYATSLKRIEIEKVWRGLQQGRIICFNLKGKKDSIETEKYKVIKRNEKTVLLEKTRNGLKETFSFGDFVAGDIYI